MVPHNNTNDSMNVFLFQLIVDFFITFFYYLFDFCYLKFLRQRYDHPGNPSNIHAKKTIRLLRQPREKITNNEGNDIFVATGCLTGDKKEDATLCCCTLFGMFTLNFLT